MPLRESRTILPQAKKNSKVLIVVDFPTIEDNEMGILFSGLDRRAAYVHRLIVQTGVPEKNFSFASACSCVTRRKAIIEQKHYDHCSSMYLKTAIDDLEPEGIFVFGSVAASCLTGSRIESIESVRGIIQSYGEIPMAITYQLGVVFSRGCTSCGNANAHALLIRKDLEKLLITMKKSGTVFSK